MCMRERVDRRPDRMGVQQTARSFFIVDRINYRRRDSLIVRARSLSDRLKGGERSHSSLVNSVYAGPRIVIRACRLKIP